MLNNKFLTFLKYLIPLAAFLGPAISYEKFYLFHFVSLLSALPLIYLIKTQGLKEIFKKDLIFWIIVPFWFLLSFLWSDNTTQSIRFELQLLTGLFCLFSIQVFLNSNEDFNKVLKVLGILFVIHLVISILEAYTSFRLPISPISPLVKSIRSDQWVQSLSYPSFYIHYPTSFFWHPNNVALVTVCSLPLFMGSKLTPFFKATVWFISLLVIVKAGAKAMLVLFCIYSSTLLYRFISRSGKIRSASLPIALLFAVISTLFWTSLAKEQKHEFKQSFVTFSRYTAILPKFISNQFFETNYPLEFHGNTRERFIFMEAALAEYKRSPILGIGAGQLYNKKVLWKGKEVNLTSIHNYWLEMLVIGGPIYFITYLIWFTYTAGKLLMSINQTSRLFGESMVLFFFAAPVMSSVFYFLPKWLLYGLAVKCLSLKSKTK